jgi:hypothetical protein
MMKETAAKKDLRELPPENMPHYTAKAKLTQRNESML